MLRDSRTPLPGDTRSNRLLLLALALVLAAVAWSSVSHLWEGKRAPPPAPQERPATAGVRGRALKVLAVMIQDDGSPNPLPTAGLERRLRVFAGLLDRVSFGRLTARTEWRVVSARDVGASSLTQLSRGFFEWRKRAAALLSDMDYDVLLAVPSDPRPEGFCTDNATLGSPFGARITLCLERYHDTSLVAEDEPAAALLVHKLLHGYGFNHQIPEHKPLVFLEWATGLPRESAAPFGGFEDAPPAHLDPYVLRALGLAPHGPFEKDCLIGQGLVCVPWRGLCSNLYSLACLDSDRDGQRDSLDPYPLSPPGAAGSGDEDRDGIPDEWDLCPGPRLEVDAEGLVGPAKVVFGDKPAVAVLRFAADLRSSVTVACADLSDGFTRFPKANERRVKRGEVRLPEGCPIARVELRYRTDREYLRPFYLYTGDQQWETVWDKEWLYFSRFGCDVPTSVDLRDHQTFDADLDGLPDASLFPFAARLTPSYDWDKDGVPDELDTLPTVQGKCHNDSVAGVPDRDADGRCDPSALELLPYQKGAWPEDLAARLRPDPQADTCPYTAAPSNLGCP